MWQTNGSARYPVKAITPPTTKTGDSFQLLMTSEAVSAVIGSEVDRKGRASLSSSLQFQSFGKEMVLSFTTD